MTRPACRRGAFLALLFCIIALPVRAQGPDDEIFYFARSCRPDVERLCPGVIPGGGRLRACVKQHIGELSPACLDEMLKNAIGHPDKAEIKLTPGPIAGREVHIAEALDYAYCEIGILRFSVADVYNTSGTSGLSGGCPADVFKAIKTWELGKRLDVAIVRMNPDPQAARRHWVMDQIWFYAAGETMNFAGVDATWMAWMRPIDMLNRDLYHPVEIRRLSQYLYGEGSTVFLMHAPDGKVWVMQSYATEVDRSLTYATLEQLGAKLKTLPKGWSFETKVLDRDLTIDSRRSRGVAYIIRDELHDLYEGCGFDTACNFVP